MRLSQDSGVLDLLAVVHDPTAAVATTSGVHGHATMTTPGSVCGTSTTAVHGGSLTVSPASTFQSTSRSTMNTPGTMSLMDPDSPAPWLASGETPTPPASRAKRIAAGGGFRN